MILLENHILFMIILLLLFKTAWSSFEFYFPTFTYCGSELEASPLKPIDFCQSYFLLIVISAKNCNLFIYLKPMCEDLNIYAVLILQCLHSCTPWHNHCNTILYCLWLSLLTLCKSQGFLVFIKLKVTLDKDFKWYAC